LIARKLNTLNTDNRLAANEMAAADFHLLPLKKANKVPEFSLLLGNKTEPYRKNKANKNIINSWFDSNENINIGVFAGTKLDDEYSLVIVDLDKKPTFGFPITPIVETSRGYHLYFKCKTNNLPTAHKTERGEIKTNGYVVAPPSLHQSGITYRWADFLSFQDVPLADFEDRKEKIIGYLEGQIKTTDRTKTKRKKRRPEEHVPTINIYSRYKGLKSFSISTDKDINKKQLVELSKNADVCLELMHRLFNINIKRIGASFKCPLHDEDNPSAALYRIDNGAIGFKDFHRSGSFYTLPELYFEFLTGKHQSLKSGIFTIWWCRMLSDSKIIKVPPILTPKPLNNLSDKEKILFKGFVKLLEVQQAYDPTNRAAPYTRGFAADWTGLNRNSIGVLKSRLVDKGYIRKVEEESIAERIAARWELVMN
jgi:hypothetical protein